MSTRRQVLAILAAGGVATAAYTAFGGGGGMVARGLKWPRGGTPPITPAGDHYQVSKNFLFSDPRVEVSGWRLDVHGLVARPLSLSLDDLRARPALEMPATLACVGNNVPARAINTAIWKGVRLASLLEECGADLTNTRDVVFIGADNYTDSVPLERALHRGTLLAYEMNGEPVPRGHGAPLRAIVPGIYGMKNVKWIEAIELVNGDYLGYWQQRGWSDPAPYQTLSRIDEPRNGESVAAGSGVRISGIAFSGDRQISRVELHVDGAPIDVRLDPAPGPFTWVTWSHLWRPTAPGSYTLRVRAYDGAGEPQPARIQPSFPNGATGLHQIAVSIT